MRAEFLGTLIAIFAGNVLAEVELPDYIHVCHKSDPELDNCILQSIENLKPHLAQGIPEIDVPGLEPLHVGDLTLLDRNQNGFGLITKDIYAYEAGNFHLNSLRVIDFGSGFEFELFFHRLRVEGTYDVNGQFLTFPVKGKGKFDANFTNIFADVKLNMDIEDENGKNRYTIKDMNIKIRIGKGRLQLYNLFGGDKILGSVVNEALNQNFASLSKDLIPVIERALAKKLKSIARKILSQFTYEQLLPE